MLEKILVWDTNAFVYLNALGADSYDSFWLLITKQLSWTPLFLVLLWIVYKKIGIKNTFIFIITIAFLILCTDQLANLFKYSFQRLRPCNNPDINQSIRIVKSSVSYSFFSAHAANSMAVSMFIYLNFKKHYPYLILLFFWPLIFAYSRIYLGLHYPLDILTGYFFGALNGFLIYLLYKKYIQKV